MPVSKMKPAKTVATRGGVTRGARDAARRQAVRAVLARLVAMYGTPVRPRRRQAALDVLVEAMLAQNTNMANATRGYRILRRAFDSWAKVLLAPIEEVRRAIAICGLARMRARRLQALLRRIKDEHGALDLEFLRERSADDTYRFLTDFHGIGPKTAAFVSLFALDQPVLPIDNGVLRVVRRLKLVRPKARDLETQRALSPLIDAGDHYAMHVLLFSHAKARCRPRNPKCIDCKLLDQCPFGQRRVRHQPPAEWEALGLSKRERERILARFISAGLAKRREGGVVVRDDAK